MQAIIDLLAIYLIKNFTLENTTVSNASELPYAGRKVYIHCFIDRNRIIKVYIFYLYLLGSLYCHGFGFQSYFVRLKIFELHWRVGNVIGVAWSVCFVFPSCTLFL